MLTTPSTDPFGVGNSADAMYDISVVIDVIVEVEVDVEVETELLVA